MRRMLATRWLPLLGGALLAMAAQVPWFLNHGWDRPGARLGLAAVAGALFFWLAAEGLAVLLRRRGVLLWPSLERAGAVFRRALLMLSGLDRPAGRRAWLAALLLAALAGGAGWCWYGLRPAQGARMVRALFLGYADLNGRGLRGLLYPSLDLAGPPVNLGTSHLWSFAGLGEMPGGKRDFMLRWVGMMQVDRPGLWRFGGRVDDGLRIVIDGRAVVDDWRERPPRNVRGAVELETGLHAIDISFRQLAGGATLKIWAEPPGGRRGPLDPAMLRPLRPGAPLDMVLRLRLEYDLLPPDRPAWPPFQGGRFWRLPW